MAREAPGGGSALCGGGGGGGRYAKRIAPESLEAPGESFLSLDVGDLACLSLLGYSWQKG